MKTFFKGIFWILFFGAVITIIGRVFFFNIAKTNSYAMVPNLLPGDTFLVLTIGSLGPGDAALCRDPENPGSMIVSRIMGVPGSTFAIRNNNPLVNGRVLHHQVEGEVMYEDNTGGEQTEFYIALATEKLAGTVFTVGFMDRAGDKNFDEYEVEEGFFLVGDNRNRTRDSRHFGEVAIEDCVGMPFLVIWPGPDSGDFQFMWRFLDWIH